MTDTPTPNVVATVIGGTGDGTTKTQQVATPIGQPNIELHFVPTATALLVRGIDTFLTVFLAVSGLGAVTSIDAVKALVPSHVAYGGTLEEAVIYSALAAGIGTIKDLAVIVGKLKAKYPLLDV